MNQRKNKLPCALLLLLLIAGHIVANIAWASRNRAPVYWDQADYLTLSQIYLAKLQTKGIAGLYDAYVTVDPKRAPLLPVLALPFYKILGNYQSSAMCVNYLAVIVLCLSIYGIGGQIGDRWLGLIAAYLTMLTPAVFGLSREFFVEFPMAAAAAGTIYFCLRAHRLPFYFAVPMIALFAAATMLLKVSFPIFIALPILLILLWQLYHLVIKDENRHLFALLKTLAGIVIALGAAATWYIPNLNQWVNFMMENVVGARGAQYGASAMDYVVEEMRMTFLAYHVMALALLLVFSAATWLMALFIRRKAVAKTAEEGGARIIAVVAVIAWFVVALYACLSAKDKDARILFPALPALAIIMAMAYRAMARGWRAAPATALLLFPLVAFFNFSFKGEYDATVEWRPNAPRIDIAFHTEDLPDFRLRGEDFPDLKPRTVLRGLLAYAHRVARGPIGYFRRTGDYYLGLKPLTPYVHAPNSQDWKGAEIVEFIEGNIPETLAKSLEGSAERGVSVMVIPNNPYLQPNWLNYLAARDYADGRAKYQMSFADPGYHALALMPATCAADLGKAATPDAVRRELLKRYADAALAKSQFILVTEGGWQGPSLYDYTVDGKKIFNHDDMMQKMTDILPDAKLFERLDTGISLPDGSRVILYRHRHAGGKASRQELQDFIDLFARSPQPSP